MAPGGTLFRFPPHFGENVLPHGSHEWLPYSKDEVRLKTVNNNFSSTVSHRKSISPHPPGINLELSQKKKEMTLDCGIFRF